MAAARPGWPRPLRLEAPHLRITIVQVPAGQVSAVGWVVDEVAATSGFVEAHYDDAGYDGSRPCVPCRCVRVAPSSHWTAATCCWSPAAARASPPSARWRWPATPAPSWPCSAAPTRPRTTELAANLRRMTEAGVIVHYERADVTDPAAVRRAVAEVATALGPVTAVLHGAGTQRAGRADQAGHGGLPTYLRTRRSTACARCWPPSTRAQLRLLVTFGSIIGRAGLRGEAHYATRERLAGGPHPRRWTDTAPALP